MSNEELVSALKRIVGQARAGQLDDAMRGYAELFASPAFQSAKGEDQRQALRLMIHARGLPPLPTAPMQDAHRAALPVVRALATASGEPADYEMLGMCHVVLDENEAAAEAFRVGLAVERERNPQSDLCGALMRRLSQT
jgi:hypothetical protein